VTLRHSEGRIHARAHVEKPLAEVPRNAGIVTVCDDNPATHGWLGSEMGHRVPAVGVERFGRWGSIADLYAA
jgi:pyruvate dehydrogenase E1 component